MALIEKIGYGQVEPNHLSAQATGQIYAQAPAVDTHTVVENGEFMKLVVADNEVGVVGGSGEWMLVYNEVKLYEKRHGNKDFALKTEDSVDGQIYPRLLKVNVGDRFTTNLIDIDDGAVGEKLIPTVVSGRCYLKYKADVTGEAMVFEIMSKTTMPDGQVGYKVVRTV